MQVVEVPVTATAVTLPNGMALNGNMAEDKTSTQIAVRIKDSAIYIVVPLEAASGSLEYHLRPLL